MAEFAAVAFRMKLNEVSEVFETEFGFHILQVLEKKGQLLKVRHILKKPKMYSFDLAIAKAKADSIYKVLLEGNSSFGEMASKYSSEQSSKGNGGILMNPKTGDAKFMAEDLDPEIAAKVSPLKAGMFTRPEMAQDYGGGSSYKIYKLVSYTEAQLDRFMFNIWVDYPTYQEEIDVVKRTTVNTSGDIQSVLSAEQILFYQQLIRKMPVADNVFDYAVKLARKTRKDSAEATEDVKKYLYWGAGPRASQYLIIGAKVNAALRGKYSPDIEDVKAIAVPILRHRISRNYKAEADGISVEKIIESLL